MKEPHLYWIRVTVKVKHKGKKKVRVRKIKEIHSNSCRCVVGIDKPFEFVPAANPSEGVRYVWRMQ